MSMTSLTPEQRLQASIAFYTETLGFELSFRYKDFYAGVCAGPFAFHLKLVDEQDPSIPFVSKGEHIHLYVQVDDVRRAAQELKSKGVPLKRDVCETEFGTREVMLEDDQGHTVALWEERAG